MLDGREKNKLLQRNETPPPRNDMRVADTGQDTSAALQYTRRGRDTEMTLSNFTRQGTHEGTQHLFSPVWSHTAPPPSSAHSCRCWMRSGEVVSCIKNHTGGWGWRMDLTQGFSVSRWVWKHRMSCWHLGVNSICQFRYCNSDLARPSKLSRVLQLYCVEGVDGVLALLWKASTTSLCFF